MNQFNSVLCLWHLGILFTTLSFPLLPKLTTWVQPKIRQRKVGSSRTQHGNQCCAEGICAGLMPVFSSCLSPAAPWPLFYCPEWELCLSETGTYGLGCWSLYPNKLRIMGDHITQTLPLKMWKYSSASESVLKVIHENECMNESGCQPPWLELIGALTELLALAFWSENNGIIQHGELYIQHWLKQKKNEPWNYYPAVLVSGYKREKKWKHLTPQATAFSTRHTNLITLIMKSKWQDHLRYPVQNSTEGLWPSRKPGRK